jgi:hypothetical protein
VSSYSRNTFTRGASCLCLVRCPLYMFAAATYRGTPHLQRRKQPTISPWSRRAFWDISPGPPPFPSRGAPDARRFWFLHTFGAESQPSALSAPKAAPFGWVVPAQQNSHSSSSVSVSVKSPLQSFPLIAEAAREPKPSARPDVVKASEGHFPQQ